MIKTAKQSARTAFATFCIGLSCTLSGSCAVAGSHDALAPRTEISGFARPEAVFQQGDVLYVSNMNTPGDGFISKVDWRSGSIVQLRFLPRSGGLRKPMGMLVIGDVLYVADTPNIVGFDLRNGSQVFDLPIADTGRLNDLVLAPGFCGSKACFLVSDDGRNRILTVIPEDATYSVYASNVRGANGLAFDAATQTLYVAGLSEATGGGTYYGALYRVGSTPPQVVKLFDSGTFPDGIGLANGRVYFSDWGNTLSNGYLASFGLDPPTPVLRETDVLSVNGPADFALSVAGNQLFIPALVENKVIVQPFRFDDTLFANGFEAVSR